MSYLSADDPANNKYSLIRRLSIACNSCCHFGVKQSEVNVKGLTEHRCKMHCKPATE